jgi:outer membrane biosynthesis protein TonB
MPLISPRSGHRPWMVAAHCERAQTMSETPRTSRRRGRPKGTGIDDSATLRNILAMLVANDDLKPTTAIRRTGITDPSVVRRLREKLKLEPPPALAASPAEPVAQMPSNRASISPVSSQPPKSEPGQSIPVAATPTSQPPRTQDTAARISQPPAKPAKAPSTPPPKPAQRETAQAPRTEVPPQPEPQSGPGPSASAASAPPPPDPQLEALRLSAEAAAAMSRLYLHCVSNAAQTNPLTLALTGQTVMSQWFAGLMQAQIAARQKPKT